VLHRCRLRSIQHINKSRSQRLNLTKNEEKIL
jgi:hypothetical protein